MATQMQLKVLFGRKLPGRPDFYKEKTTKSCIFRRYFFMFTLTWRTQKEPELVIENKGDQFRRKKNTEIQSGGEKMRMLAASKVRITQETKYRVSTYDNSSIKITCN